MSSHFEFIRDVPRSFHKLDKHQTKLIVRWLYQHVDGIEDSRSFGNGLTANRTGQWRYRIGNYRVIVEIEDNHMVVTAINIGY